MSTLITLGSFNGTDGANPEAGLIADAAGDLFGTTYDGGANGYGAVFEIINNGTPASPSYASTPITLVSFNSTNGADPQASLIADTGGDLLGTTFYGGADGYGAVFEIMNNGTPASPSYASTPITLVSFNGTNGENPQGGLIADANGDLFGTTYDGGANGYGTVFEIAKTGGVYASTPTTLVSFNNTNGADPQASLIADARGDLFGTTYYGGANGDGEVFEIMNNGTPATPSYASTPTVLASFNGTNGEEPYAGLIADAYGDLFGTTQAGGASNDGTVFEIPYSGGSYANTPTVLANFNFTDGAYPDGNLIADGAGDLFGTTLGGGTDGYGTVFEIKNIGTPATPSYASTPTTLENFNGANDYGPASDLIADATGNLYGTTTGVSAIDQAQITDGTAFELSGAGFMAPVPFAIDDTTTGVQSVSQGTPYSGPVYGLVDQYINATATDTLAVAAGVPNTFIRIGSQGGSGEAAIDVSHVGGTNVLDGEYGSDFLVGGTGPFSFDTFFVEDGAFSQSTSSVWSTVVNFHAGDAATIWGITQNGSFNLNWVNGQGAAGYTGLTLNVTAPGVPEASLTLSGYTTANLPTGTDPTLTTSYGTVNGTPYLYIQAHS
jgi:uncharacterized repeat protein (TIGR03803 family)